MLIAATRRLGQSLLQPQLAAFFTRRNPQIKKKKERNYARAAADEKMVKLTTKEDKGDSARMKQDMEDKAHEVLLQVKNFDPILDRRIDMDLIIEVERAKLKEPWNSPKDPQQGEKLKNRITNAVFQQRLEEGTFVKSPEWDPTGKTYLDAQDEVNNSGKKFKNLFPPVNDEYLWNEKLYEQVKRQDLQLRYGYFPKRTGVLGFKVGMISTHDIWGSHIALTVIQLDRCQVTQIKETKNPNEFKVQVGVGQKSLFTIKKPQIGHYLKHNLIPNLHLKEFTVTKENLLPVGFRLGARHFTPGQLVDVRAVSRHRGFQGAMKRWGFAGLNASHGVSVAHRSLGSTGMRQDPGRVFKGKKMHGHMGGRPHCVYNLRVFKVDFSRCLVYIMGSVPGKVGEVIEVQDARFKLKDNFDYLNFPTFIPEKDTPYADIVQMQPPPQDPAEVWLHDNALPKDDEEDDAASVSVSEMD